MKSNALQPTWIPVLGLLAACAVGESPDVERDALSELQGLIIASPDAFAGLIVDEEAGVATVHIVEGRSVEAVRKVERHVEEGVLTGPTGRYTVEYRAVTRSQSELDAIRDSITQDSAWIEQAGGALVEWGVAPERNVVEIGVIELTPELERQARERFGDAVELFEGQRFETHGRLNDSDPFYGGIEIWVPNMHGSCTAGIVIQNINNANEKRITTAGHCWAPGTTIFNGDDGTPREIGIVLQRKWDVGGLDIAFIGNKSYSARQWIGPRDSFTSTSVKGWVINPFVGMSGLCLNGAQSGEVCNAKITEQNRCFDIITETGPHSSVTRRTCALTVYQRTSFDFLGRSGDSGGAVYTSTSGGKSVVGSHVGGPPQQGDRGTFHEVSRFMPSGWRVATQ